MNIVLISTLTRPEYLRQSWLSLLSNASRPQEHHWTVVLDGPLSLGSRPFETDSTIVLTNRQGASASRNIGASSISKYRRQKRVMFVDDDVYACPGWDQRIEEVMDVLPKVVVSGHAHPFNHPLARYDMEGVRFHSAGVLSTVHMVMDWDVWDDVGWWAEPGGPGGSEDVDWCARATAKGYGLATTDPQCIIHCGLTSSSGKQIVGYELMAAQNEALVKQYGLEGKVQYA